MTRLRLMILALMLSLAVTLTGVSSILASTQTLEPNVSNTDWQVAGNIFHYQATMPGLSAIVTFDTIVHEATSSLIRIDVVIIDGTSSFALQGSYSRTTREDVSRPGVYAPLWIRQADVDRGYAFFGNRNLTYNAAASTLERVFEDGESRYAFHKTQGYLVSVVNARSGGQITLVGKGTGATLPTSPQTTESQPITVTGSDELKRPRTLDASSPSSSTMGTAYQYEITTLDLTCKVPFSLTPDMWPAYSIDGYYGERCISDFFVETTDDFSYGKHNLAFPRFAVGWVEGWYRDENTDWGGGTVRHYTCKPIAVIATVEGTVTCDVDWPRGFSDDYAAGRNWIETQGVWNFCIDPTTGWSCNYTWTVPATGHIVCYEEGDKCRPRT